VSEIAGGGRDWQHRWVVRMHKVVYRGPYIKGPDDKPLLDGETVWGLGR
jgi:hypothetical protein